MSALGDDERRRYARQVLLPEIGAEGQARLCAARFRAIDGDPRAAAVAARYLERAGPRAAPAGEALAVAGTSEVAALAGRPELERAAAFVAGAFAAVEHVKRVARCGQPGELGAVRLTGPDDPAGGAL